MADLISRAAPALSKGFTEAMDLIQSTGREVLSRLLEMDAELGLVGDATSTRKNLSRCVQGLRSVLERRQKSTEVLAAEVKNFTSNLDNLPAKTSAKTARWTIDPATGLPERSLAEPAIKQSIHDQHLSIVAVFVLERLDAINTKFGYQVGDQVFRLFAQHIRSDFAREHKLYRWTGPAVMAVVENAPDLPSVRSDVLRITARRFTTTIDLGGRYVLLSVGARATVIPAQETLEAAVKAIDQFVRSDR